LATDITASDLKRQPVNKPQKGREHEQQQWKRCVVIEPEDPCQHADLGRGSDPELHNLSWNRQQQPRRKRDHLGHHKSRVCVTE